MKKLLPIARVELGVGERADVVVEADEAIGVGEVLPLERGRQVVEAVDGGEHDRKDHEAEEEDERRSDEEDDLEATCGRRRRERGASVAGPGPAETAGPGEVMSGHD